MGTSQWPPKQIPGAPGKCLRCFYETSALQFIPLFLGVHSNSPPSLSPGVPKNKYTRTHFQELHQIPDRTHNPGSSLLFNIPRTMSQYSAFRKRSFWYEEHTHQVIIQKCGALLRKKFHFKCFSQKLIKTCGDMCILHLTSSTFITSTLRE